MNISIGERNSISSSFRDAYKEKNESKIVDLAEEILKVSSDDCDLALWYGRDYKIIISFYKKKNIVRAKKICEEVLSRYGVFNKECDCKASFKDFGKGNYSYSWPVIFANEYLKILKKIGKLDDAIQLADDFLKCDELKDDAKVMFEDFITKGISLPDVIKIPVIEYIQNEKVMDGPVEIFALEFLKNKFSMDGVFAINDLWRMSDDFFCDATSEKKIREFYKEETGLEIPKSFFKFLKEQKLVFQKIFSNHSITFGQCGYPDLILYSESELSKYIFIEVKSVNDRIAPHQKAWAQFFLKNDIPFSLLKFKLAKKDI